MDFVTVRDLLHSSGPPQAEVRNASKGKCKNIRSYNEVNEFEGT